MTITNSSTETRSLGVPPLADLRATRLRPFISPDIFTGLVRTAEGAMLTAVGFVLAAVYVAEPDFSDAWHYLIAPFATAGLAVLLFQSLGLYRIEALTALPRQILKLAAGWFAALCAFVGAIFLAKAGADFSRGWLVLWAAAGFATLIGVRVIVDHLGRQALAQGRLVRRAVIYGTGAEALQLIGELEADPASDVRICGVFDDRGDDRTQTTLAGYPKLGTSEALVAFARATRVDVVILTLPLASESRVAALVQRLSVLPVEIKLAASSSTLRLHPRAYSYIGSVAMLDVADKPIDGWGRIAKAAFDRVIAALAILTLAPVMALIALAVRLESSGPVLFRQRRLGFNNEVFEVLKFRSMYIDACDYAAKKLVTRNDPRVTRVGRFLRRTSLDELPQLFNVLNGSLSLVGPRPHAVEARAADRSYHEAVEGYFARHKVKPGITGWAQINGWRGETDTEDKIRRRVEHDMWYIRNWSFALDIYILLRTPLALFKAENAY